jgi:hypothetical protein
VLLATFLFTAVVAATVGRAVFGGSPVTHHHIQGAIVVYLHLTLLFVAILFARLISLDLLAPRPV